MNERIADQQKKATSVLLVATSAAQNKNTLLFLQIRCLQLQQNKRLLVSPNMISFSVVFSFSHLIRSLISFLHFFSSLCSREPSRNFAPSPLALVSAAAEVPFIGCRLLAAARVALLLRVRGPLLVVVVFQSPILTEKRPSYAQLPALGHIRLLDNGLKCSWKKREVARRLRNNPPRFRFLNTGWCVKHPPPPFN